MERSADASLRNETGMGYLPRVVDDELSRRLDAAGAVVIEGPQACGKTETAKRQTGSVVLLDVDAQALAAARVDPSLVLNGPIPRLLDEWQVEPAIWNHVRRAVDERQAAGRSAYSMASRPHHPMTRVHKFPMSRDITSVELGESNHLAPICPALVTALRP